MMQLCDIMYTMSHSYLRRMLRWPVTLFRLVSACLIRAAPLKPPGSWICSVVFCACSADEPCPKGKQNCCLWLAAAVSLSLQVGALTQACVIQHKPVSAAANTGRMASISVRTMGLIRGWLHTKEGVRTPSCGLMVGNQPGLLSDPI